MRPGNRKRTEGTMPFSIIATSFFNTSSSIWVPFSRRKFWVSGRFGRLSRGTKIDRQHDPVLLREDVGDACILERRGVLIRVGECAKVRGSWKRLCERLPGGGGHLELVPAHDLRLQVDGRGEQRE